MSWPEVADLPLKSRDTKDEVFQGVDATSNVVLATNSLRVPLAESLSGRAFSILPLSALPAGQEGAGLRVHPIAPEHAQDVCLVRLGRETQPALSHAAWQIASKLDIIEVHMPLYPSTEHFFNDAMFAKMKRGAYLINTARGKLMEHDAVVRALKSGHIASYAGDVWFPQPAPPDHPWRTMPWNGMMPHISGSPLSAQARYAAGAGAQSYKLT